MKTKGILSPYKAHCESLEEARKSDKVICLVPSGDGKLYEVRKLEQGEFIAPAKKASEFQVVKAGFTPALPLIPMALIGQITAFFRSFMRENEENEALALIYWDKVEQRFFAYVPPQVVSTGDVEADLRDCPYDDDTRYIRYADLHSHNSMEAFFSPKDDQDEQGTGLYLVMGQVNRFFPELRARFSCNGSFVEIDPGAIIEGLTQPFPEEWSGHVKRRKDRGQAKPIRRPTGTYGHTPSSRRWSHEVSHRCRQACDAGNWRDRRARRPPPLPDAARIEPARTVYPLRRGPGGSEKPYPTEFCARRPGAEQGQGVS